MPGDGPRDFEQPTPPDPNNLLWRGSKWPKLVLVLVCGLALLIAAVPQARNLFMGYQIVLSKPTLNGGSVSGSFRFQHRWRGLSWDGTGGACLVADIATSVLPGDEHKAELNVGTCTTDDDCLVAGKKLQRWWGYCLPSKNEGHCWYRPVEPAEATLLCRRSIDYEPPRKWDLGKDYDVPEQLPAIRNLGKGFDVHEFYAAHTGGNSANWRMIGVLNNSSGKHERYGDQAELK